MLTQFCYHMKSLGHKELITGLMACAQSNYDQTSLNSMSTFILKSIQKSLNSIGKMIPKSCLYYRYLQLFHPNYNELVNSLEFLSLKVIEICHEVAHFEINVPITDIICHTC